MNFSAKKAEITPYTDRLVWVELDGQDNDDILKNIEDEEIVKHLGVERVLDQLEIYDVLDQIDIVRIVEFVTKNTAVGNILNEIGTDPIVEWLRSQGLTVIL